MVKFIIISKSQDVMCEELDEVTLKKIHELLQNNKKEKELKKIHTWDFDDDKIEMYGYINGKEKEINKLELPEPIENKLYYNELIFFSLNDENKYIDLDEEDFEDFYDMIFGGFDDIDSEDSGLDFGNDEYEDDGFVVFD
tara:strand:+ start:50 stop:469 length:420 start_codon:yes stop_codon:yes gene_type:complete